MALDDLDLEFEDEEEQKKSDALDVDVDLSFSANGEENSKRAAPSKGVGQQSPKAAAPNSTQRPPQTKSSQASSRPKSSLSEDDVTDPNLRIPKDLNKTNHNPPGKAASSKPAPKGPGQVKSLDEARKNAAASGSSKHAAQAKVLDQRQPAPEPVSRPAPSPQAESVAGVDPNFHQEEIQSLREEILALREEMRSIQHTADVKVAVAEAKAEFIAEHLSDAKLMDHQVNQILQRIHQKVPQLKNEVLTIKKYVGEFLKKSGGKK